MSHIGNGLILLGLRVVEKEMACNLVDKIEDVDGNDLDENGEADEGFVRHDGGHLEIGGSVVHGDDEEGEEKDVEVVEVDVFEEEVVVLGDVGGEELDDGVHGHELEAAHAGRQSGLPLADHVDARRDVLDPLRGEVRSQRGLLLVQRQSHVRTLQSLAVVRPVPHHHHSPLLLPLSSLASLLQSLDHLLLLARRHSSENQAAAEHHHHLSHLSIVDVSQNLLQNVPVDRKRYVRLIQMHTQKGSPILLTV